MRYRVVRKVEVKYIPNRQASKLAKERLLRMIHDMREQRRKGESEHEKTNSSD